MVKTIGFTGGKGSWKVNSNDYKSYKKWEIECGTS